MGDGATKAAILACAARLDLDGARRILAARPTLAEVTDRQGRNLLHLACSTAGAPAAAQRRMVAWLLDAGFGVDEPFGRDACTPLFLAVARARSATLASFLVARGASPRRAPGGGLFAAAWWDDTRSLDVLLDAGAPVDVVAGVTPFLAAWGWRRFRAAKHLARRGADVDAQDAKGRTALRLGLEREDDPALLRWLVRHGASPDVAARDGVTPRLRASRKRDPRFARAIGA